MNKILFIDDEINILNSIKRIFHREPYQVLIANSGEEAMNLLKEHPDVAVVVSDFRMPYMTGSEVLEKVSSLYPRTIRMILSGYADKDNIIETINKGHIYKFLIKPWDDDVLKQEVKQALTIYQNNNKTQGLDVLVNGMSNGVIVTDSHHNLKQVNKNIESLTGLNYYQRLDQNIFTGKEILSPASLQVLIDEKLLISHEWNTEGYIFDYENNKIPVSIHIKKFTENDQTESYYIYQIIDITKQKEIEQQIHNRYHRDQTTGLYNRYALIDNFSQHLLSFKDEPLSILGLEFSRFKEIYESMEQNKGDQLLKLIGQKINILIGEFENSNLYYLGQGQFIVTLKKYVKSSKEKVAQAICQFFTTPFTMGEVKIPLNVNIAISCYPKDGTTIQEVLSNCSDTLVYIKNRGINEYSFHEPSHKIKSSELLREELFFESELHEALSKNEFDLYYQPFIDFETNKIFGCEALIRWNHPRFGLIPPDRFIPLLEKTNLIFPVTQWILIKVFKQIKAWEKAGFKPIKVAVNLSSNQFQQPGFYEELVDLVNTTGVPASCVELEITESMLMDDINQNKVMLEKIRSLGFHLSLDDFGTGYSSFSLLKKLPFNILKIDRSFVQDITQFNNSAAILSSMIAMGQSLGMHVIAEGIETSEQLKILKSFNCDYGQGYYYSKPVPPDKFLELLQNAKIA